MDFRLTGVLVQVRVPGSKGKGKELRVGRLLLRTNFKELSRINTRRTSHSEGSPPRVVTPAVLSSLFLRSKWAVSITAYSVAVRVPRPIPHPHPLVLPSSVVVVSGRLFYPGESSSVRILVFVPSESRSEFGVWVSVTRQPPVSRVD